MQNSFIKTEAERQLLLELAGMELDDRALGRIQSLCTADIDWEHLHRLLAFHGLTGIAHAHLALPALRSCFPDEFRRKLRETAVVMAASNTRQVADFASLAAAFREAGVRMLVLKGAAFGPLLYHNGKLRPISDVDVLIREQDWPTVRKLLEKATFTPCTKDFDDRLPKLTRHDVRAHLQYINEAGTVVEFQFDLLTLGISMRNIERIWQRSQPLHIGETETLTLTLEDHLLHACVHANRHGFTRIKWLIDIAELVRQNPGLDWDYLEQAARLEGVECCVFFALKTTARLLPGFSIDERLVRRFDPGFIKKWVWQKVWPEESLNNFTGRDDDVLVFAWYDPFRAWNFVNYILTDRVADKLYFHLRFMVPPLSWLEATSGQPRSRALLLKYLTRPLSIIRGRNRDASA